VVRDPIDVARVAFICGMLAWAAQGRSTALGLAAASALLVVARLIDLPRPFDLAVILAMTLVSWGTALSLYGRAFWYDNLVHALAPLFYAPVLYIVLVRLQVLPDLKDKRPRNQEAGIFLVTLSIGLAVTAGYEAIEWLSDSIAGTHYVKSADDTGGDIVAGACGSAVGATLLLVWSLRGWTTVRRTPAEALHELMHRRAKVGRTLQGPGGT
jgi:hypothetical protein